MPTVTPQVGWRGWMGIEHETRRHRPIGHGGLSAPALGGQTINGPQVGFQPGGAPALPAVAV